MYFPDLTPYRYGGEDPDPAILNVGWLSHEQAFERGPVPSEFILALEQLVEKPLNLYRGSHICEFCPEPPVTLRDGMRWISPEPGTTGNGEVRVRDRLGTTYVAPVLVLHYIRVHNYIPPQAFIMAVVAGNGDA
jgi:hypothetical protein